MEREEGEVTHYKSSNYVWVQKNYKSNMKGFCKKFGEGGDI